MKAVGATNPEGVLGTFTPRPRIGIRLHPLVVLVERRLEQQDGGDAPGHLGDVARLLGLEATPEQSAIAVGEPLLHHLVAAYRVLPDAGGDAAPVGDVVQVDVVAGAAEAGGELVVGEAEVGEAFAKGGDLGPGEGALEGAAAAGHGDAALAAVTPAGGDGEVADGGVELAPEDRGEHADRAQLVANGAGGDCVNRLLDVEERRDGAAELGGYGYCASHSRWFWGFRLHLLAAPDGTPRALELADPRRDEREVGLELLARCRGGCELLICDKGYAGREFAAAAADL